MTSRLPQWFKQELPGPDVRKKLQQLASGNLHTVCREAGCPNIGHCFARQQLTFMILGDVCTRDCLFCSVKKARGGASEVDASEPAAVAAMAGSLGLRYAVITSVTRDDLNDGGARQFVRTTEAIRRLDAGIRIELLIPDFSGNIASLKAVADAGVNVIGHNIETVKRLYPAVRPKASYSRSLRVLRWIKDYNPDQVTKSAALLGMGESEEELVEMLRDLYRAGCDILVLGQYLAPSHQHYPVKEFISAESFSRYGHIALEMGFKKVLAAPLARSSFQAEQTYSEFLSLRNFSYV